MIRRKAYERGFIKYRRYYFDGSKPFKATNNYNMIKIVRVDAGGALWEINGHLREVARGDFVIFSTVDWRALRERVGDEPFVLQCVETNPAAVYPDTACLAAFFLRPEGFDNVIAAGAPWGTELDDCFRRMTAALGRPRESLSNEYSKALLTELMVLVNYAFEESGRIPQTRGDSYILMTRAIDFIGAHYREELSEGTIADALKCQPERFSRTFRELTGMSWLKYVRSVRISATLETVAQRDVNILDAALGNGFGSASGFYKAFSETMGCSPTEYLSKGRRV